jgi:hypothetical protein
MTQKRRLPRTRAAIVPFQGDEDLLRFTDVEGVADGDAELLAWVNKIVVTRK